MGHVLVSLHNCQVIQITGTFLFPDLAVPDFDDAHKNSFKATIASAAGVSRDSVHIRAVRAASVEVDWAVAMPATGSAGDGVKAFEEAMATPNSDMFDPSTFGNVELVSIAWQHWTGMHPDDEIELHSSTDYAISVGLKYATASP